MKPASAIIAGLVLFGFAGCNTPTTPEGRPAIDGKAIVSAHEGKDRSVVEWADKIDALVDQWLTLFPAPELAGQIKSATEGQRAAVKAAPASQFNVLIDFHQKKDADNAKIIAGLRAEVVKANDRFFFLLRAALMGGGSIVMAISVFGFFALSSITAAFPSIGKQVIFAVLAFGATLFAIGFAYEWAYKNQGWAIGGLAVIATAIITAMHINRSHEKLKK